MKLEQVRPCDGACCRESPRAPNTDRSDCLYHDEDGCKIIRDIHLLPDTFPVLPEHVAADVFILSCLQFPQNTRPWKEATGGCCFQWVD